MKHRGHGHLPLFLWAGLLGALALLMAGCPNRKTAVVKTQPSPEQTEFERLREDQITPSAKTLYAAAEMLAAQGRDAEAAEILARIIREEPEFVPAYSNLAQVYQRQGRTRQAVDVLTAGRIVAPDDPIMANNLGMCWLVRGEYERALQMFSIAASIVPENARYRGNMAVALGLLGRDEESLALFRQILPAEMAEQNARILSGAAK